VRIRALSCAVIIGTALSVAGTPEAAHAVDPSPHSHAYKPQPPGGGPVPWKAEDGWQPDPPPGPNDAPIGYSLKALAYPLVALASGSGYITNSESDVDSAVDMAAFITYELQVDHGGDYACTWSAQGGLKWDGEAHVQVAAGAEASIALMAALVYDGDLSLRKDAHVAVDTGGSGTHSVSFTVPVGASYTYTSNRTKKTTKDKSAGSAGQSSSGSGHRVRVDVTSSAHAEIHLDTSPIDPWEVASAGGMVINEGTVQLGVVLDPIPGGSGPTCGA